jgi:hypothetical protein
MKSLIVFVILAMASVCFGADVVPVAASPVSSYFGWLTDNWGLVAAFWLAVEQILAATSLKSNSTFQIVCNIIDAIVAKKQTPPTV